MTQALLAASEWLNFNGLADLIREWKRKAALRAEYNRTVRELSALSDFELRDIGISRGMIHSVAMEAHYDNIDVNKNLRGWV